MKKIKFSLETKFKPAKSVIREETSIRYILEVAKPVFNQYHGYRR